MQKQSLTGNQELALYCARRKLSLFDTSSKQVIDESCFEGVDDVGQYHFTLNDISWQISESEALKGYKKVNTLLKDVPIKKGDKRVAFLLDSFFIGNASGIYTFIKHFAQMCAENALMLDVIVDVTDIDGEDVAFPNGIDLSHVSLFSMPMFAENSKELPVHSFEFEKEVRSRTFEQGLAQYLRDFTPSLVVSHSYASTLALDSMNDEFDALGIPRIAYTHIGDIMSPDSNFTDFSSDLVIDYLRLLKDIKFEIGTQTIGVKSQLESLIPEANVKLLPEPFYEPRVVYRTTNGTKGVLIIGSNYERKNFDLMFEILAITGLPVTVVCGQDLGRDGRTLKEMAHEAGVQGYRQLTNVPNDFLPGIIRQHRVLLHLSDIEIMPYAILEASVHIPCVVNGNAPWSKDFPCPHIKVDPNDIFECVQTLSEAYGDTFEYRGLDVDEYAKNCEEAWLNEIV
ncbi:hypothetical protein Q9X98_004261 [Vibrio parahaemolyticus]|uniref:hypothetical protein n=1 Tax=Vibrio harveyi group TaxID=717610 RepID=UPI00063DD22C|nr:MULTISPECIES: hypothetical protein [Vibrio harveyi group]EJL8716073.1 hypothetical protein [Vibrio alginolyticus]ELA7322628.1 hypothetical protein [Vibrio parahaemolyticus]KLI71191.1 hypothetical protein AAW26_16880 [Vibrio alginolyticus]MBS9810582.1 hypothetical protein [Vibrio alginolyticus]MCF9665146.1 hypothetical protein [Vibrio parahaemolyticus]